ncbi:MAG TPA: protein kinase [Kofleriaceae bacterium]|nr:protein kinase [Kofleriaceae bacterium]
MSSYAHDLGSAPLAATGRGAERARTSFEPPEEFDDYVIIRQLGQGATGQVYLAEDSVLARPIAIKFIGVDPDPAARQRFLMEARAAARIQHPNVVSIYRVGELGDRPYLVTELVRGTALSDVERPMAWPQALAIAIDLARGLAAAHRRGVVHCDIKPANAMLTEEGVAKLVDFGLAQVLREGSAGVAQPMSGTPDYMAPEVWTGQAPTRRSDVYSLGAVIHELISGQPPFAGVAFDELGRVVVEQDAPALDTEPRLAALVARCLARDPDARFASGEELREAFERLQAARGGMTRLDENPYRGLRPFESSHRGVFFGRGLEVGALVERLRTEAVVVVAGDSGVGKSSLIRAGVVPAVLDGALGAGRTWRALTVVPGRRPLAALAAALDDPELAARVLAEPESLARELHRRAAGDGLILFVDQMEELVTVGDPDEVAAFDAALARISEGVTGVRLLTTVRADFLSKLAALPRFGQELSRVLYFVRPLPPERIRDVITGPAAATDVRFESEAMINALVDATAQAGSGGLPLLSFALAELWEARDRARGLITQAALDTMGGVAGALARHGDAVLAGMPPADRAHARRVLLRLVTSLGTRVARSEAELAVSEGTQGAVTALVKGRLLVVHDGEAGATYELAHEVLVRGWGTLREWLDADAEDRARRERLAEACAEWQRLGRRPDATWRGPRLVEALALDTANLTPVERAFIAASVGATRRRRWWWRGAIAGVVGLVAGVYAIQHERMARRLADEVDAQVAAASDDLARARTSDREQRRLAGVAYTAFDAGDAPGGEATWRHVLDGRASAARAYRSAARSVEAALAKDPTRADVRDLFGDILLERAELADAVHDGDARDELIGRLPAYDRDGSRRARASQPGRLIVHAPPDATLTLDGVAMARDAAGGASQPVPPGPHVVDVTAPGRAAIHEPIVIARGEALALPLTPPPAAAVPAGYVYIAPGWFLYGSAGDEATRRTFLSTVPLHRRHTDGFLIGRTEVTFGDWIAYIESQPASERAQLAPNLPLKMGGGVRLQRLAAGWQLSLLPTERTYTATGDEPIRYVGRAVHASADWRKLPVLGISATDAAAYAAWLDRTGRLPGARLCSELEWERAARGPDGRDTPTGRVLDGDDANLDSTYPRDLIGPDEVGSHPASASPYRVLDTAGNAFEWTRGERPGVIVARGGSYFHDRKTAELANRNETSATIRDATAGIRLCANVSGR